MSSGHASDEVTLQPLPDGYVATRRALHSVAEQVVAPARKPHNEIALRQTPGGFGTPVFEFEGAACQVRVEGAELVVSRGGEERRDELTTLAAAGELVGADLFPDGPPGGDEPLGIDPVAARRVGDWYAFARDVLGKLVSPWMGAGEPDPSLVQLWPENFDLALEAGPEAAGRRANYGASPGDDDHPEPYLYVGPWTAKVEGELWNAEGFAGALLPYPELVAAEGQKGLALEFLRERAAALEVMIA